MADKDDKLPENVAGKWYVDANCVPCHTCMEVEGADKFLKYNEDETYVYFFRQPEGEEEEDIAQETLEVCPTEAIGDDGDED
jgi:ferredoxin